MRAIPRRGLAVVSTAVGVLILAVSSMGAAQDATDDPLDTPSPFCAVLTAEEASTALGVALAVGSSSATDCSYDADLGLSDVSLIALREYGPITDDYPRLYYPEGIDLEVGGHTAYYDAEATTLFVDEGANDQMLVLQLFGGTPEQIDVQAALEELAAIGLPRLASIPLPVDATPEPEPSYFGDAELATLIPATIEGSSVDIQTRSGADILADVDTTDPEIQESVTLLEDTLARQGRTIADLSIADASYPTEEGAGIIQAVRVKGADIAPMADDLVSLLLMDLTGAIRTPTNIGGKDVTIISDEPLTDTSPAASEDPVSVPLDPVYLYRAGEIVWLVIADEPGLTEVFEQLP